MWVNIYGSLGGYVVKKGRFGRYGGQYIPETLMNAVQGLKRRMSITKIMMSLLLSWQIC